MNITIHSNWDAAAFDHTPLASAIGPFVSRPMLHAWWQVRGEGDLLFVEAPDAMIPMRQLGTTVRLLGEADLFDYHSPLGTDVARLVAEWSSDLEVGTAIDFDSLPAEAADEVMTGLSKAGLSPTATMHESAAVLELEGDYETYLARLSKKQRHETRRKARRFAEILGEPRLERSAGQDAVDRFATMHRLSDGDKGSFMTPSMEALFVQLHVEAGAVVDFLFGANERPVAAAFGFEDADGYFLYNSAYDPDAGAASPGIVLVNELIKRTIELDHKRFDFLKGDEVYKYRLGAEARPLWRVEAVVGGDA